MSAYLPPPAGWLDFGAHADGECPHYGGPLTFSDEVGEDGLPRWERHDGCTLPASDDPSA